LTEERKGLIERLKRRKTIILREPLLARLERKRRGSPVETQGLSGMKITAETKDEAIERFQATTHVPRERIEVTTLTGPDPVTGFYIFEVREKDSNEESDVLVKSTYELFVEKASRELAEAKQHLRRYAETTECGWCKAKAEGLAKMTEQLEALTPLAQEFSEKVGALEAEELQKLSEEITQIREWLEKAAGNPANKFHVRYIDQTTGKTVEKTIPNIEQYELYRLQREGKISIIEIHTVK